MSDHDISECVRGDAKLDTAIEAALDLLIWTRRSPKALRRAAQCVYDYLIELEDQRLLPELVDRLTINI